MTALEYLRHQTNTPEWVSNDDSILETFIVISKVMEEYASIKTKELKDKLKEQMYNITTQSGEEIFIVEWEDIERIINTK